MLKRELRKKKWVDRLTWFSNRLQALFWVSLASLIIYKTNFFRQLWENEEISSMFLNLGLVCIGLNCTILSYVTVVRPLKGLSDDLEECPNLVPVMAAAGVLTPILMTVAIWPVWGFLSPIYIFILSFGYIFALTFLPGGKFGTVLFWILMVGLATMSHLIPHENHEHAW